jgi:hypothetical protein
MMYLQSPPSGANGNHHDLLHNASQHTQAIHGVVGQGHRKIQCGEFKLTPPQELMTRPQALRFQYHKEHGVSANIKLMSSLTKKEDPEEKERMEAILRHVHEVEIRGEMNHPPNSSGIEGSGPGGWEKDSKNTVPVVSEDDEEEDDEDDEDGGDDFQQDAIDKLVNKSGGGMNGPAVLEEEEPLADRMRERVTEPKLSLWERRQTALGGGSDGSGSGSGSGNVLSPNSTHRKTGQKKKKKNQQEDDPFDLNTDDGKYSATFSFLEEWVSETKKEGPIRWK